jgi:hypothetical protein
LAGVGGVGAVLLGPLGRFTGSLCLLLVVRGAGTAAGAAGVVVGSDLVLCALGGEREWFSPRTPLSLPLLI